MEQAEIIDTFGTYHTPPPPSAAEIMMEAERNRRDQTRLLELIEHNTARQRNVVVSIHDFILLKPLEA